MRIGGFQKTTLIDYPGKVACSVFAQGCSLRCRYCQNPQLVLPPLYSPLIPEEQVFSHLEKRRGKIEGVVITGGEPTLQPDLLEFMAQVKARDFLVKLDTNGLRPQVIKEALAAGLVDFIAMDVKTSLPRYRELVGVDCDTSRIKESIDLIHASGLMYQFRTTVVKSLCSEDDLHEIRLLIGPDAPYVLQPFVVTNLLIDPDLKSRSQYTDEEFIALQQAVAGRKDRCLQ